LPIADLGDRAPDLVLAGMSDPHLGSRSPWAALWTLDPDVAYLNHGSFGACPKAVIDFQARLRDRLEREPVDFLARDLPRLLAEARAALGPFVGADPDDLAFVANATSGVNAVLRSLPLSAGDELLTTDHCYGACRKTLDYVAAQTGARVVVATVPFPLGGEDDVLRPVLAAVTFRTRLAVLDHVTSPTALVFPLVRLVGELRARGVDTLVDGAHAPGMVPLDLNDLGAAYYAGNAHKWLCAPKGAAFLHVRRDRQEHIHPLVISHGYESASAARFRAEFDWTGTDDPTPFLAIPECLRYLGSLLPGGWPGLMTHNHDLALEARAIVAQAVDARPPCPDGMVGSLASLLLPAARAGSPAEGLDHERLTTWFRERGVETWLHPWAGGLLIRVSAQLYNHSGQYHRLASLLGEALLGG
jgi:isopenicillin-N epimerase